jgi:hypothetical protein
MLRWVIDIAKLSDNNDGERCIQSVMNTPSFTVNRKKTA